MKRGLFNVALILWPWIIQSRSSWQKQAIECAGINCGRFYSETQIEKQKKLYESNAVITRPLGRGEF